MADTAQRFSLPAAVALVRLLLEYPELSPNFPELAGDIEGIRRLVAGPPAPKPPRPSKRGETPPAAPESPKKKGARVWTPEQRQAAAARMTATNQRRANGSAAHG